MSHELTPYLSVFDIFLAQWIMAVLSKGCKPDNFESHNSLKLYKYHFTSFTNICSLCSNFECESFLESNSPDNLALCNTILDESIDSGNFSVTGYFPLIWKNSVAHMYGLTDYVKEGLPLAWNLSVQNYVLMILTYVFNLLYYSQCLTSFSSINNFLCLYVWFLILIYLT